MKSIQTKGKLSLNKQSVSRLSKDQQLQINGGVQEEAVTTSFGRCTRFTCCGPDGTTGTATIIETILTITRTLV